MGWRLEVWQEYKILLRTLIPLTASTQRLLWGHLATVRQFFLYFWKLPLGNWFILLNLFGKDWWLYTDPSLFVKPNDIEALKVTSIYGTTSCQFSELSQLISMFTKHRGEVKMILVRRLKTLQNIQTLFSWLEPCVQVISRWKYYGFVP